MANIQELLDESAKLANIAYASGTQVDLSEYYTRIKALRGTVPPLCWGHDDCSTETLSRCPWRIDCGE